MQNNVNEFLTENNDETVFETNTEVVPKNSSKKKIYTIILIIIGILLFGGGIVFAWTNFTNKTICTQDVKQCSDGSYVKRTIPFCKFQECPDINTANRTENSSTSITETVNLTADWKTYRNEEYGFEMRYPRDWEITSEKNEQYCSAPEFRLYMSPSTDKKTFLGIIYTPTRGGERLDFENICLSKNEKEQLFSKEVIYLNDIKMYKETKTVIPKETKVNSLTWDFSDKAGVGFYHLIGYHLGDKDYSKIIGEIVSTFKLTSEETFRREKSHQVNTNGWKIFRNDIFGFEIQYPSDWIVCVDSCLQLPVCSQDKCGKKGFYKNNELVFTIDEFLSNQDIITVNGTSFLEIVKKYGGNNQTEGYCGYDEPIKEIKTENGLVGYQSSWYCCGRGCGTKSLNGFYTYFENLNITRKIDLGEASLI